MTNNIKHNRDFKGIWIPKEIWLNNNLTLTEKLLLVEIDSLDNEFGCTANNAYFANFFGLNETTVSHLITQLHDKKYISRSLIDNHKRVIKVDRKKFFLGGCENTGGGCENRKHNNTYNNTYNNKLASKPAFNSFERDDPHIEIGAQPKPKPTQQPSKQSLSDKQQDILRAYHNSLKATSTLDSERIDEILHAEEKQKAALTSIENYLIESGETVPQLEEIFKNKHAQYANKEQGYAGLRLFASDDCAVLREQKSQKVVKLQKKQEIDKKTADKNAQIKQDILDIKEAFAAKKLERTQDKDNVTEKLNLPFNSYKDIADKILQATIHGVYWWDGRKVLIVEHADVDFLAEYQVYINNAILRANVAIDRIINITKHD